MDVIGRELALNLGRYHSLIIKPEVEYLTSVFRKINYNLYLVSKGPFSRIHSSAEKLGYLEVDGEIHIIKDNPGALSIGAGEEKLIYSCSQTLRSDIIFSKVKMVLNTDITIDGTFIDKAVIEGVLVID